MMDLFLFSFIHLLALFILVSLLRYYLVYTTILFIAMGTIAFLLKVPPKEKDRGKIPLSFSFIPLFYFTTLSIKRVSKAATSAREAGAVGNKAPLLPLSKPTPIAQRIASFAQSAT